MRPVVTLILLSIIAVSALTVIVKPSYGYSGEDTLFLSAPTNRTNTPPIVKVIYPVSNVWSEDPITVIVKVYDPDGVANVSVGLPGQYMERLFPWEPQENLGVLGPWISGSWNTTLYEGSIYGSALFEIVNQGFNLSYGIKIDTVTAKLVAEDSQGATTSINLTIRYPDHSNPPVLIYFPLNGSHLIRGEGFQFHGGMPIYYWPCPILRLPQLDVYPFNMSSCGIPTVWNSTITVTLDGRPLFQDSADDGPKGWIIMPGRIWVETQDLGAGAHKITFTKTIETLGLTFSETSTFYIEDPGDPAVYKVANSSDASVKVALEKPNVTIIGSKTRGEAKIWVYNNTQPPGSPPPYYIVEGPILVVTNNSNRLGVFHLIFHLDPGELQQLGIRVQDLVPLAWDRDLNIWYPKGKYKVHPENNTVEMWTSYPFLGGGLYIALTSKTTPAVPPTVTILAPEPGAVLESGSVTLKWEAHKGTADITGITLTIDGSQTINLPPTATSYSLNLPPGTHEITIQVEDSAGHKDTATTTFTIKSTSQEGGTKERVHNWKTITAAAGGLAAAAAAIYIVLLKTGITTSTK
ncbi:MAG: Ig-like domain-containing protein [Desulfurococcales archaeon]|nr:Ig-like domain-containing protein [Desulfurococcales archaeon]